MRNLTIAGASAGAGATTLTALAYLAVKHHPGGTPSLQMVRGTNLPERTPTGLPRAVSPHTTIRDAGVLSVAEFCEAKLTSSLLVLVTAATPLGHSDAAAFVHAIDTTAEQLQRVVVVSVAVFGPGSLSSAKFPVPHLHIPFDRALSFSGPVPEDLGAYARSTRVALRRWSTLVANALGG